jgi:hypothetical protein
MKNIIFAFLIFPLVLNAQIDEAESNSSVGFNHQLGGQIGLLGVYAYMERSIGLSWTYRADVGFDFQGHDPLQEIVDDYEEFRFNEVDNRSVSLAKEAVKIWSLS